MMVDLFERILAGFFLALALALTCSISYYYEKIAFSRSPLLAIGYMALLMFCCILHSVLSGGES